MDNSKIVEKMKQRALEWQQNSSMPTAPVASVSTAKACNYEDADMIIIADLKRIISESSLERKAVILTALTEQERKISQGIPSTKLPEIVRNLSTKPETRNKVLELVKKYSIDGKTLQYLWGIQ